MKWLTGIDKLLFKIFYTFAYTTAKVFTRRKPMDADYYEFQAKANITKWLYERVKDSHSYEECMKETERVWKLCKEGKEE